MWLLENAELYYVIGLFAMYLLKFTHILLLNSRGRDLEMYPQYLLALSSLVIVPIILSWGGDCRNEDPRSQPPTHLGGDGHPPLPHPHFAL